MLQIGTAQPLSVINKLCIQAIEKKKNEIIHGVLQLAEVSCWCFKFFHPKNAEVYVVNS